jgi:mono/diheme cytochrome c family protein
LYCFDHFYTSQDASLVVYRINRAGVKTTNESNKKGVQMKIMIKILKWTGIVLVLLFVGLIVFVQLSWNKTFDAPYPEIVASIDSAVIARGKHLVFGPAHCATCHVPMDKIAEVEAGLEMPLIGGWELEIPPGTFRAPNITPDMETGIGNLSDGEIARTLRYSVNSKHNIVFPFMPFQELSDDDLTAIISYLRSQEPVNNFVEPSKPTFLGKAVLAFGLIVPEGPKSTPPKSVAIDSTIAYGAYLAGSVANCVGCHTKRDAKTGAFVGAPYAGGLHMPPDELTKGYAFVSPNLTPHKETGIMAAWDESAFVNRFRVGRVYPESPMPWGAFSRMTDLELKALYRYLQSLDPVEERVDKIVFAPGEAL